MILVVLIPHIIINIQNSVNIYIYNYIYTQQIYIYTQLYTYIHICIYQHKTKTMEENIEFYLSSELRSLF